MFCDLHTHSIYSDGTLTPAQIITEAKKIGLGAIALTDHNTVAGLPEFMEEAKRQNILAVGGVELSTAYEDIEFHLLGYFIRPEHYQAVERLTKEFFVLKEISNIETIERFVDAGYEISYADVRKKNPTGNVNRAHIASELLKKGYVESISHAFQTILNEKSGFYVPPTRLQLTDAIKFLREIKAIPIIAHPLKDVDEKTLRELLPIMIEAGLMGMETYHSSYDSETIERAVRIAEEFQLLQSGGSDFHGDNKVNIHLGWGKGNLKIPMRFYEDISKASPASEVEV